MKRLFGALYLLLCLGFIVGCSDNGGSGGGGGGNSGGGISGAEELNLSGQVWAEEWIYIQGGDIPTSITYSPFTRNVEISYSLGGEGSITNGQLNFNVGTPTLDTWHTASSYFYDWRNKYRYFEISNPSAKAAGLWFSTPFDGFSREFNTVSRRGSTYTGIFQRVEFVYVDQDITIVGYGRTNFWEESNPTLKVTEITKDINITLKKGWNSIFSNINWTATVSGSGNNLTQTMEWTETVSIANPNNLRWVLID